MSRQNLTWAAIGGGALVALVAGRGLLPKARLAVRRATGVTYRDQKTGEARPQADPALGRPA